MKFLRMIGLCQGRVTVLLLWSLLGFNVGGCASSQLTGAHGPAQPNELVALPITGSGVPYLLQATIAGKGPYLFILDTGSTRTVVSPRLTAEAGLHVLDQHGTIHNAEGAAIDALGETRLPPLAFGGLTTSRVDALVMDLGHLERALGERIDGIASGSLFADFTLVIDDAIGAVYVTRGRIDRADGLPMQDSRLPIVPILIDGVPTPIMIDSASAGSWVLPNQSLRTTDVGFDDRVVAIADGANTRARVRLDGAIQLGDFVFDQPIVEHTQGVPRVGWHALAGFRVSIDRRSGRASFEQMAPSTEIEGPVRGIGARLVRHGDLWEVRSVEPMMPAALAGLRDGERVFAIEGKRVGELDQAQLRSLIQQAGRIRLDVMRGQGIEQVFVPVVYIEP